MTLCITCKIQPNYHIPVSSVYTAFECQNVRILYSIKDQVTQLYIMFIIFLQFKHFIITIKFNFSNVQTL